MASFLHGVIVILFIRLDIGSSTFYLPVEDESKHDGEMILNHPGRDEPNYRAGENMTGTCTLKPDYMARNSVTSQDLVIETNEALGNRLSTRILDEKTVEFTIQVVLEEWTVSCSATLSDGRVEVVTTRSIGVGRAPLPISDKVDLVVDDWKNMTASFYPGYWVQRSHSVRPNVSDNRLVTSYHIQWSPGSVSLLRNCSELGRESISCTVSGDDYFEPATGYFLFRVTVWTMFGVQTKGLRVLAKVKPAPVDPVPKALNSTSAEVRWVIPSESLSKHMRYEITFVAQNFNHKVTRIVDHVLPRHPTRHHRLATDRATVTGLSPASRYVVGLRRIPLLQNGTERGYYSDMRETADDLLMMQDVPGENPEILPAVENKETVTGRRDVIVYIKPIDAFYRNGNIHVSRKLYVNVKNGKRDVIGRLQNSSVDVTALRIENLESDRQYELEIWAENEKFGANSSLPVHKVMIEKLEPVTGPPSAVEATIEPDDSVKVTYHREMQRDRVYYLVFCPTNLVTSACEDFPQHDRLTSKTASLSLTNVKPNTYRVGVYSCPGPAPQYLALRTHARRNDVTMVEDDVMAASSIEWSPCIYNASSVPKITRVEIEAGVERMEVRIRDLNHCDENGAKVEKVILKSIQGPDFRKEFEVAVGTEEITETVHVAPGMYKVAAQTVNKDGLGPPALELDVVVPGRDYTYTAVIGILVFVVACTVVVLLVRFYRSSRNRNPNFRTPAIDDDAYDRPGYAQADEHELTGLRVHPDHGYQSRVPEQEADAESVYDEHDEYTVLPRDSILAEYHAPRPPLMVDRELPELPGHVYESLPNDSGNHGNHTDDSGNHSNRTDDSGHHSSATGSYPSTSSGTTSGEVLVEVEGSKDVKNTGGAPGGSGPNAYPAQTIMPDHLENNSNDENESETVDHSDSECSGSDCDCQNHSESHDESSDPFGVDSSGNSFRNYDSLHPKV